MKAADVADFAAGALVFGYIGAVIYNQRPDELARELAKEARFLEFLLALAAVWFLATNKTTGRFAAPITGLAVVAALLSIVSRTGAADALDQWSRGQISLLDAAKKIFGGTYTEAGTVAPANNLG